MIKHFIKSVYRFFFPSPDPLELLRKRGLIIGNNVNILRDVIIDPSHCSHIIIGDNVTLAPRVHILAHDASLSLHFDYIKIGKVKIGNNVFIGAESIVMPGVEVGDNSIIGAGSVVTKSIPENSVAVGNPARIIMTINEFIKKQKKLMLENPCFGKEYLYQYDSDTINRMNSKMTPFAFISWVRETNKDFSSNF